ncbi:Sensor histidine kinase YesM [Anaerocolumna jejuensis DSM 15929]|uniref:Sensor histidine kinase YesM n=1 Tax=Anaerocolumna jejuensis DSM 15929 TaxID=1121322 RepID=A0A1M6TW56_9FIRM|nr:histidine kinase [Anaerocolumna jejuensis]SHK61120.1 Sensor histidine kinase YesM [Anaerocolumna jejuensis DSM 15929]
MSHIRIRSLRVRLGAFIILIFILLIALMAANNIIAFREIQSKIYDSMKETLTIYQNRLNASFSTTEKYLKNYAYDDGDIRIIDKSDLSSEQYFSSVYHVQKSFRSALSIYAMDGFFLYSLGGDTFIEETQSDSAYNTYKNIQNEICRKLKLNTFLTKENNGKWFPVKINGKYYLFRVIQIHNSYIGAWISVKNALQPLVGKELNQSILLINDKGVVVSDKPPIKTLPMEGLSENNGYQYTVVNSVKNLIVSCQMDFGRLYIVSLIPENQFFMDINKYIPFLMVVFLIVICLMALTAYIINRWVIHPLNYLNTAIYSLKSGNLEAQIKANGVCIEFEEVNNAFNEMVSEIKTLKIDVYEESLSKQQIHIQYLMQQIAPHFLINCLNMAYQLAEINRTDLMKMMLKDLSQYLRYTLSSGQTVSLKQEIMHVENYIELSKIRYPNSITLYTDFIPETMHATVIPLLIQNFVENTVKYEVMLGKEIAVHISSSLIQKESGTFIAFTIWDTGCGFNKELLERLEDIEQYSKDPSTKHIGISNVLQRASLIFGPENCSFHFSNRPEAGAQIDIELPFIPFFIKEELF